MKSEVGTYNFITSRTIVLVCNDAHQALREKISGVYFAATKYNWQVLLRTKSPTLHDIGEIRKTIKPIGFIVDPMIFNYSLGSKLFGSTPVVLLSKDYRLSVQRFDCSCQNTREPVLAAVKTLDGIGPFECLAYVGHPSRASWSIERGEIFGEYARCRGRYLTYIGGFDSSGEDNEFLQWLTALPKPCGLFLATDHIAPFVFNAIHRAQIDVPKNLAVISVDDIHEICLNVNPPLTSVNVNFFHCGENAVELLRRRLQDPKLPVKTMTYGVITVSRRKSTMKVYPDKRLNSALEFITENITSHISSRDVIRIMGCGRRHAEQLFLKNTGKSILHTLHALRLERAMTLLKSSSIPLEAIPSFCGYDSNAFFKTLFRRETGMTMGEWRRTGHLSQPDPSPSPTKFQGLTP